jgi:hypothetical protein
MATLVPWLFSYLIAVAILIFLCDARGICLAIACAIVFLISIPIHLFFRSCDKHSKTSGGGGTGNTSSSQGSDGYTYPTRSEDPPKGPWDL